MGEERSVQEVLEAVRSGPFLGGAESGAGPDALPIDVHAVRDRALFDALTTAYRSEFEEGGVWAGQFSHWPTVVEQESARLRKEMVEAGHELDEEQHRFLDRVESAARARVDRLLYRDWGEDVSGLLFNVVVSRFFFGPRPDRFFDRCFEVLSRGMFPFGWEGKHPKGRIAVWTETLPERGIRIADTDRPAY